ncbi:nitroreductase family deazaflavin-dependent oxidoreductase [Acrocarpospora catenulata]|uniref:nitroreductase family deazaflavin-dependent oxidoreductase n=1 Tax=Acrocarpospora catenulata TaxID=2836182 RepID=UPI001BD9EBD9|nr:nitroreductase family deazaflavin-dependent oxidoreductase [Acrocarpospora catenulata]
MTESGKRRTGWDTRFADKADHIARYLATDGEDGYLWSETPTLLLTTRGRRSGQERTVALIFGEDDGRYILVASQGGAPRHPNWYLNILADPVVTLQVKADRFTARARTATGEERERLWKQMVPLWEYDVYATRTDRVIPVVVLERQ